MQYNLSCTIKRTQPVGERPLHCFALRRNLSRTGRENPQTMASPYRADCSLGRRPLPLPTGRTVALSQGRCPATIFLGETQQGGLFFGKPGFDPWLSVITTRQPTTMLLIISCKSTYYFTIYIIH
jgi:hypothetical protein